jgi:hypothetical protein
LHREKRQHWQDLQSLERERRDILHQLEDLDETPSVSDLL